MIGKTLFKQFQIYLNGILVEDSSPRYAWRSIIETELNFDKETKNSTLSLAGYASDEKINDPTSSGYKRRSRWIQKDGEAQFAASLNLNLFNQPRLLLNYVDFKLVAYLNEPKFVIDSLEIDKDLKKPDETIYTYEILDMKLLLHEYELYDSVSMAIEQLLKQEKMITYPLTNIEMRSFYVAPGRFDMPECRLLTSALPKRIVMCMVDAQSYLGSHSKSPFNFRHFDVKDAFIECGGRTIPSRPLNLDFEKDRYMPAYLNMLEGTGMGRSVGNNGITREMYKNGSAFFVFEISPSLDSETVNNFLFIYDSGYFFSKFVHKTIGSDVESLVSPLVYPFPLPNVRSPIFPVCTLSISYTLSPLPKRSEVGVQIGERRKLAKTIFDVTSSGANGGSNRQRVDMTQPLSTTAEKANERKSRQSDGKNAKKIWNIGKQRVNVEEGILVKYEGFFLVDPFFTSASCYKQ
ncbi:hypothetical protein PRIPAC_97642 [Pristionchus pacificus]|uniref:Uncharacterized protein n=1 Tax=Pristionchus pacificus TaxID=54126 RepID=A0A2A6D1K1_PRIPA|nr:hypothetical protein PRIPAC_97642 [Pristionchus pacificus]|eukprot:PDM84362.1 hypothetical protein PRIPAC_33385 [Pristionchus pacificus]